MVALLPINGEKVSCLLKDDGTDPRSLKREALVMTNECQMVIDIFFSRLADLHTQRRAQNILLQKGMTLDICHPKPSITARRSRRRSSRE